jgi:type I restriction enzyme M protein
VIGGDKNIKMSPSRMVIYGQFGNPYNAEKSWPEANVTSSKCYGCCGSGGMFVSSADFVASHNKSASDELSIFGQEKTGDTVRLSKMNLAVHGLQGDIREGNSYYEDPFDLARGEIIDGKQYGQFDRVMANPPFNVNEIQKDRLEGDKQRFPYGMPRTDNGNYIWIQMFYAALNKTGRAGFVMANSASDARGSEQDIRQQLIEDDGVDVMVAEIKGSESI